MTMQDVKYIILRTLSHLPPSATFLFAIYTLLFQIYNIATNSHPYSTPLPSICYSSTSLNYLPIYPYPPLFAFSPFITSPSFILPPPRQTIPNTQYHIRY